MARKVLEGFLVLLFHQLVVERFPLAFSGLRAVAAAPKTPKTDSEIRAYNRLNKYCTNKESLPFLHCELNEDGTHAIKSGTFGAGVFATFENDPLKHRVFFFQGCSGWRGNRWYPRLDNSCIIVPPPRPPGAPAHRIPVFLKVVQAKAEAENKSVGNDEMSAFRKEVQRSRGASFMTWRQYPIRLAPRLIEVGVPGPNGGYEPHWMQKESFSLERIAGEDAGEVRQRIAETERALLRASIKELKRSGGTWNASLDHLITAFWRNFKAYFVMLDGYIEVLLELFGQSRLHCDMHLDNLMITRRPLTAEEMAAGVEIGSVVPDRKNLGMAFIMQPTGFKVIDAAYFMAVNFIDRKTGRQIDLRIPCLLHRTRRPEDFTEFYRSGIVNLATFNANEVESYMNHLIKKFPDQGWEELKDSDGYGTLTENFQFSRRLLHQLKDEPRKFPELVDCWHNFNQVFGKRNRQRVGKLDLKRCDINIQKSGLLKVRQVLYAVMRQIPGFTGLPIRVPVYDEDSPAIPFGARQQHAASSPQNTVGGATVQERALVNQQIMAAPAGAVHQFNIPAADPRLAFHRGQHPPQTVIRQPRLAMRSNAAGASPRLNFQPTVQRQGTVHAVPQTALYQRAGQHQVAGPVPVATQQPRYQAQLNLLQQQPQQQNVGDLGAYVVDQSAGQAFSPNNIAYHRRQQHPINVMGPTMRNLM